MQVIHQLIVPQGNLPEFVLFDSTIRSSFEIEAWDAEGVEQIANRFRAPNPQIFPRGNVKGQYVFTTGRAHASLDAALAYHAQELARVSASCNVILRLATGDVTMANANLKNIAKVKHLGVWLELRYRYTITTTTTPIQPDNIPSQV